MSEIPPFTPRAGAEIGGCVLIDKIGEGGQAPVWKARQNGTNKLVAVKLLPFDADAPAEEAQRLEREIEFASKRDHSSLVPVFHGGRAEGCVYYVMPFIEGGHLGNFVRDAKPDEAQCAELIKAVADGVAHLHRESIIHRDLKPANILLDEGRPRVADFGLAKSLLDTTPVSLTGKGALLGTENYMAPEQAARKPAGKPADVWALGVILYEMLAGSHPLDAVAPFSTAGGVAGKDDRVALLTDMLHANRSPRSLRDTHPHVDGWLADIVKNCLKADPIDRYEDAGKVYENLGRWFANDRPERANRRNLWDEFLIRFHRKPAAWIASITTVVVTLAFAGYYIFNLFASAASERAQFEKLQVSERRTRRAASEGDALRASALIAEGDTRPGLAWLARSLRRWPENRDAARMAWLSLLRQRFIRPFAPAAVAIPKNEMAERATMRLSSRIMPAPDLRSFTVRIGTRSVGVWGEDGKELFPRLVHPHPVRAARYSHDGGRIATGDTAGVMRIWDAKTGALIVKSTFAVGNGVEDVHFTRDGARGVVLGGTNDSQRRDYEWQLAVMNVADGSPTMPPQFIKHRVGYENATVTRDGQWLIAGEGNSGNIHCHPLTPEAAAGRKYEVTAMEGHHTYSRTHPTEPWVMFLGQHNIFRVWDEVKGADRLDGAREFMKRDFTTALRYAASTPDGRHVALGGTDSVVRVFDWATGEPAGPFLKHTFGNGGLSFSPDSRHLLTLEGMGAVRWWDWQSGIPLAEPLPRTRDAARVSAQPLATAGRFVTLDGDGVLEWWELSPETKPVADWKTADGCAAFDIAADGTTALLSGRGPSAWKVDIQHPDRAPVAMLHQGRATEKIARPRDRARISRDGRFAATLDTPQTLVFRSTAAGAELWRFTAPANIGVIAFNPVATLVAAGCADGHLVILATDDGSEISHLTPLIGPAGSGAEGQPGEFTALRFSDDGLHLAAGTGQYCTIRVWDTRTWQPIHKPRTLGHVVEEIAFQKTLTPPFVWIACWTGAAERYRLPSPTAELENPIQVLHGGPILGLSLNPSHTLLATASDDGTAALWDPATGTKRLPSLRHPVAFDKDAAPRVHDCAFSPDGEVLATCDTTGGVRLWSTATLDPLGLPLPHPAAVVQIAFAENGTALITAAADGIVRKWNILPSTPAAPRWLHTSLEERAGLKIDDEGGQTLPPENQRFDSKSAGDEWEQLLNRKISR